MRSHHFWFLGMACGTLLPLSASAVWSTDPAGFREPIHLSTSTVQSTTYRLPVRAAAPSVARLNRYRARGSSRGINPETTTTLRRGVRRFNRIGESFRTSAPQDPISSLLEFASSSRRRRGHLFLPEVDDEMMRYGHVITPYSRSARYRAPGRDHLLRGQIHNLENPAIPGMPYRSLRLREAVRAFNPGN